VEDLLGIIALESQRARAPIVGEDLGTVELSVRRELANRRVLSYRLLWFEEDLPENYPWQALAAVSTHDLPTLPGLWTGQDCRDQRELGLNFDESNWIHIRERLKEQIGLNERASLDEVVRRTYAALARAPSAIITASLEDVLAVEHRPNMPGTIDQWPNWCQPLPADLDALEQSPLARQLAEQFHARV
jgi:4-alpha-glucanotransferase